MNKTTLATAATVLAFVYGGAARADERSPEPSPDRPSSRTVVSVVGTTGAAGERLAFGADLRGTYWLNDRIGLGGRFGYHGEYPFRLFEGSGWVESFARAPISGEVSFSPVGGSSWKLVLTGGLGLAYVDYSRQYNCSDWLAEEPDGDCPDASSTDQYFSGVASARIGLEGYIGPAVLSGGMHFEAPTDGSGPASSLDVGLGAAF